MTNNRLGGLFTSAAFVGLSALHPLRAQTCDDGNLYTADMRQRHLHRHARRSGSLR
jgi:hypothetical protein